ncbi:MAG: cheBR, two-component system, chemotaxis family, CheB/CheR fusion protein [Schlesneria sp.]|nr:cheBR, two-component system, chemotaxis family, CheB/CheR fusion protein [Schlesneria sp.]
MELQREIDQLLRGFAPAAIVVDENYVIQFSRGNTAPYLNAPIGQPSQDLLRLLRTDLVAELRSLIEKAKTDRIRSRTEQFQIEDGGEPTTVSVEIMPLSIRNYPQLILIVFEEKAPAAMSPTSNGIPTDDTEGQTAEIRLASLERELNSTREYMQSILEENEATNEELKAANEEILSSNEELQSTNEELQTAKEEMQSTNEELATVNDELKHRNRELNQLNDDLLNLFGGLDIPVIMVSRDLRIRRFTPPAEALFNLIPSDVGRRISDLRPNIDIPDFPKLIAEVIETVHTAECDVRDHKGRWYSLRIRPYITTENKIDGAALAFIDIDTLKRTAEDLAISRDNAETIVETVWEPLVVLDQNLRVQRANAAFYRVFQIDAATVDGQAFAELEGGAWNHPTLLAKLRQVIPDNRRLPDFELEAVFSKLGTRTVLLNAHRIFWEGSGTQMILMAIEDITNRKRDQEQATLLAREQSARAEAEAQNRLKDEFLAMLAHELRNPLAPIRNSFYILQHRFKGDPLVDQALEMSDRQISQMSRLLDDLLDIARINRGKIQLRKELLIIQDVIRRAVESSQYLIESRAHQLEVSLPDEPIYLVADPARLEQVFCNLLNNAAKYTDTGGRIQIAAASDEGFVSVKVSDTGVGISPELLQRVFDLFTQADRSIDRSQGGLGIGLSLVKNLVNLHSGTVEAISAGEGTGSTFVVRLPRVESETRSDASATAHGKSEDQKKQSKAVLVVDDNRDAALTLSMLLNAAGHEVDVAYDGQEALAMAADRRPDLVLLDIGLPHMDGYEVARRLRQDLKLTDIMIVAVTGYGQDEDRRRSAEAGFDLHYIKPINPRDLDELMKKVP